MPNRSDRYIEVLMSVVLLYSRLFGYCNYDYDFKTNSLTYPRAKVIYTVIVNIILIALLPVTLLTHTFENTGLENTDQIRKLMSIATAVAMCYSLIEQWTNGDKFRLVFKQLTDVRVKECADLKRNPKVTQKLIILLIVKMVMSICFVLAIFAASYTLLQKPSSMYTVTLVYFAIMENLITIVENQFYTGLLYTGYLFEMLNNHIMEVVKEIRVISTMRLKRQRMGVLMQKCCTLSDKCEGIGRMHTEIHGLSMTAKELFQFQILTKLLTVFITQVLLSFYAILYLSNNVLQLPEEGLYVSGFGLVLSVGNLWLLIYVCGEVVYQCDLGAQHLKLLTFTQPLDSRLERTIEVLTFQLMREKMHLQLCGMIDVDGTTGFSMLSACAINVILLIQLHYKKIVK